MHLGEFLLNLPKLFSKKFDRPKAPHVGAFFVFAP